ncbi:hypothetical protein ABEW72_02355 [Bacillus velezensis]|uniref:hypothetical protein n=1 Tax=Bacillus velezensis TaxID=492670 RepID=UPI00203DA543|nr:hypothetical protein [Bacillus velezensis]MCM3105138.1 hypothetical protein [Bacillus velezensis]MDQ9148233.1 hypothetical protein [Bacillus velezensis]MEC2185613.1 hypothetical protein [Bacillus velezensis]MED3449855.1 hypothetical protein [Bacillus velezensis]
MPRLTKVRMTNIQLDEGKKIISNSLWEPNAKDALFILENGGGKTSFIQLITQTILPNSNLSKRLLKEVVYKGTTGYIMTEWKLDGENLPYEYLCLGFTYMNGETKTEELNYFTYLFTYNRGDTLNINTLPTTENGKVTRLNEYRKFLRQHDIRIFDVNRDYKKELKRFHLLEEEWKMIQKINGDEGGVDNYFKTASSTYDLLVKLLIPEVENTIFDSEEKKKEIQTYFKEYSKNLLSIPDMKRDLEDFQRIKNSAEDMIKAVEDFQVKKKSFMETQKHVVTLKKSIELQIFDKEEKIISLIEDIKKNQSLMNETDWKIDSYKSHTLKQQIEAKETELTTVENKLKTKTAQLKQAESLLRQLEAKKEYADYLGIHKKVLQLTEKLSALAASDPELEKRRNESKKLLTEALNFLIEEQQFALVKQNKNIKYNEEEINLKDKERKQLGKEKQDLFSELKDANNHLNNYKKDKQTLVDELGEEAGNHPSIVLKSLDEQQKLSSANIIKKEEEGKLNEQEMAEKRGFVTSQSVIIESKKNQISLLEFEQETFEREKKILLSLILEDGKSTENIYEDIEEFLRYYKYSRVEAEQKIDKIKQNIHDLTKKLNLWESHNFFVPNETLLEVQQHLEQKGVITMLGSEWLSEISNEEMKNQYLDSYPLLPYTLLVEEANLSEVKKALKSLNNELLNLPLLFYVKSKLQLQTKAVVANKNELFPLYNELYLYHQLDVQWFASRAKIQEIIEGLKRELSQYKEQLTFAKSTLDNFNKILTTLETFHTSYPSTFLESNMQAVQELLGDIKDSHQRIKDTNEQIKVLENENKLISEFILDEKVKLTTRRSHIKHLQSFMELYPNPEELVEKAKNLKDQHDQCETKINLCEEELIQLRDTLDRQKDKKRNIESVMSGFVKERKQHQLNENLEPSDCYTSEEKDEYVARFNAVQQEYSNKDQAKSLLEQNHLDKINELGKSERRINNIGFSLEEVKGFYAEEVNLEESIIKQKDIANTLSISVKESEFKQREVKENIRLKTEQLDSNKKEIEDKYEKEVFLYDEWQHKEEFHRYNQSKEQLGTINKELGYKKTLLENSVIDAEKAMVHMQSENLPLYLERFGLISEEEIIAKSKTYQKYAQTHSNEYSTKLEKLEESKKGVYLSFETYVNKIQESNNPKTEQFANGFSKLKTSDQLFDFDFILESFNRIFDTINAFEEDLYRKIAECEKDKVKIVELCFQRVESIYKNVTEIPKFSKVEVFGHELQLIKMRWDRLNDETTLGNLHYHVQIILETLQRMKRENKPENEMNEYLVEKLDNVVLLDKIAPIKKCFVSIYKPRKKSLMTTSAENWKPWDEVSKWSGGEEFSSYMSMFMILVTYLRKKVNARDDSWKVIIADNPFGKASSEHVVKPIMELARKSKIQLFCLTAHNNEDIRSRFECVMSNRYYNTAGIELLQVKHKEKGVSLGLYAYEHD